MSLLIACHLLIFYRKNRQNNKRTIVFIYKIYQYSELVARPALIDSGLSQSIKNYPSFRGISTGSRAIIQKDETYFEFPSHARAPYNVNQNAECECGISYPIDELPN